MLRFWMVSKIGKSALDPFINLRIPLDESIPEEEVENVTEMLENGAFSCDICPKIFSNKRSLTTHKRTHKDQCVECPTCSKKVSKLSYKTHLKLHDERKSEKWVCDTCGKNFR